MKINNENRMFQKLLDKETQLYISQRLIKYKGSIPNE